MKVENRDPARYLRYHNWGGGAFLLFIDIFEIVSQILSSGVFCFSRHEGVELYGADHSIPSECSRLPRILG